jgi:transketolase
MSPESVDEIRRLSNRLRLSILEVHRRSGGGHLGSALSVVEILAAVFGGPFRWPDSGEESWRGDRFVLSKGHAAIALYCLLGLTGRINPDRLATFGRNGSPLEPHPNEAREPSIHASTGSLGQGLSVGIGLALGSRLYGGKERTFVVIGDGEVNEGQIWEAARVAATLQLANLIVILDDNGMQQDGPTSRILPVADVVVSWATMGWQCLQCDGHDCGQLLSTLTELTMSTLPAPRLLRASTIKGCGVGFLEGRTESHFPPPLSTEELALVKYQIELENRP